MRIAVCASSQAESELLNKWISQYCMLYGLSPEVASFTIPDMFFEAHETCPFDIVFMDFGGPEGFLKARQLRDGDRKCRIIFLDDTLEYAVRGVRLHFTDYIVKPVEFKNLVRAMKLAGV